MPRLAAAEESRVYPAWRPPANPAFIPLGGRSRTQHLSRLAAARKPSIYPAWRLPTNPGFIPLGGCPRTQVYPAWRPLASPGFIPLGGCPRTQVLSCLAAAHELRFYPAWQWGRAQSNPVLGRQTFCACCQAAEMWSGCCLVILPTAGQRQGDGLHPFFVFVIRVAGEGQGVIFDVIACRWGIRGVA